MSTVLSDLLRQLWTAVRALLLLTVLLGIAYPVTVWAVGQVLARESANGSLVVRDGAVVGSRLLGQQFEGEEWFHGRPSAGGYDALASGGTNLGPNNDDLLRTVGDLRAEIAEREDADPADVPPDALTSSASGLDRYISPQYARLQVARVAAANGLDLEQVRELVDRHTDGRRLGFLGDPGVDVLALNTSVADLSSRP